MKKRLGASAILLLLCAIGLGTAQEKPEWQKVIDRAAVDADGPDCPDYYVTPELRPCLAHGATTGDGSGGRRCVMAVAVKLAKSLDIRAQGMAYTDVLLAQCHSADAQQAIANVQFESVIDYLRTLNN
jgi:hypothetical protein